MAKSNVKQERVSLDKLTFDAEFYPRTQTNSVVINQYAEAIQNGALMPPIRVEAGSYRIIDGVHRWEALKRLGIEEALVQVEATDGDADFYERAVTANIAHGRALSPFEKERAALRFEELGMERVAIAGILQLSVDRIGEIKRNCARLPDGSAEPLKRTIHHMAGLTLTPQQIQANNRLGGMQQLFYVNQIITLIDAGLIDTGNPNLMFKLEELYEKLGAVVASPSLVAV